MMVSANTPKSNTAANATPDRDQVAVHPVAAADAAVGRIAARVTAEFFLRTAQLVGQRTGGDLIKALILRAIIAGNISHIDHDPANPGQFAAIDDVPPDELRRPISVLAVAGSLGLPYETTRRCVNKLVTEGLCIRVKGGVIAPATKHIEPEDLQGIRTNMANLRRLFAALKQAGVKFD
jgi:hypothetical protein